VAEEACQEFLEFTETKAAIDPHLADQLIPYLALAEGQSSFTVSRISKHLLTNVWVVQQFLPTKITVEGDEGKEGKVIITPP
jgi:RNA 3'-terminal phosphate cyclase (ATP)